MPDDQVPRFDVTAAGDGPAGSGPVWAHAGPQLNVTVLAWPGGHVIAEHVNDEREVLLVVVDGDGSVLVDGAACEVRRGSLVVLPRGARREVRAGSSGLTYVSTHQARGLLQLTQLAQPRRR